MYKLKVITSTVRPGRKSHIIGKWVTDYINGNSDFEAELLDIAEYDLPLMNEAQHPRLRKYEHEHSKEWSSKVEEGDAYIFVTAEYDHSYPAPLRNALEYLLKEWAVKPAGIVSYSTGMFGGLRALERLKADLLTFQVVTISQSVMIPKAHEFIDDNGVFTPDENLKIVTASMVEQLKKWTKGMKVIREDK